MKKISKIFLGGFPIAERKKKIHYIYIYIYFFFFFFFVLGSWATSHPPSLGHNTMVCIVTDMAGCAENGDHDTAEEGHDTAKQMGATTRPGKTERKATIRSAALVHAAWLVGCVTIQSFVS